MQEEIKALEDNHTWKLVPLPPGKIPIGCKWVYNVKFKANCEIERYKARLVAKGYNQKAGLDYQDTFSPVVKIVTVRSVLSIAAASGWHIHQLDVYNAFLQGYLFDEVYMTLPEGFSSQGEKSGLVRRLVKSMYGLKQASRQWNVKLTDALLDSGFIQSSFDHSLFTKRHNEHIVVVLVYVDDMLVAVNDLKLIEQTMAELYAKFKIKDLRTLRYFLGIEFSRSSKGILMNQRKYALEMIEELGLTGAKPYWTPLDPNLKLTTVEVDEAGGVTNDPILIDIGSYQRLIGRLLYLTLTRPDIGFIVQTLSQFLQNPKKSHMEAAIKVVRYVKRQPAMGILVSSKKENKLVAYCDADWASCPNTRMSVTSFLIKHGESLLSWISKKQTTISRSSA